MSDDTPSQSSDDKPFKGMVIDITDIGDGKEYELKFFPSSSWTLESAEKVLQARNIDYEYKIEEDESGRDVKVGIRISNRDQRQKFLKKGGIVFIPNRVQLEMDTGPAIEFTQSPGMHKLTLYMGWAPHDVDKIQATIERLKDTGISYTTNYERGKNERNLVLTVEGRDNLIAMARCGAVFPKAEEYYKLWDNDRNKGMGAGALR